MNQKKFKEIDSTKETPPQAPGPVKRGVTLKTLSDTRRFLCKVVNQLQRGDIEESTARTFGYLIQILSSVIKEAEFESRLDLIETQMKEKENEK